MPVYQVRAPDGSIIKMEGPEGATQEQILGFAAQQYNLKKEQEEPISEPVREDPSFLPMVGKAVVRGAKQTGMLLGDVLPAMVGKAVGADEYAEEQMAEAAQVQREIQEKYPAAYPELKDVKGVGDAVYFAAETIAEQIPNLVTALVPGGGAAAIGAKVAAKKALTDAAREVAEKGLTGTAAKTLIDGRVKAATAKAAGGAGLAGTYLGSYALNAPEIFQNVYEETGEMAPGAAALAGSLAAALDSILPAGIVAKLGPAAKTDIVEKLLIESGMQPGIATTAVSGIAKGAITEGPTEATQEAISIVTEKFVGDNQDVWGSKEFNRLVEAGVRGAVGGAGISAGINVGQRVIQGTPSKPDDKISEQLKEDLERSDRESKAGEADAEQLTKSNKQGVESGVPDSIESPVDNTGDSAKAVEKSQPRGVGAADSDVGKLTATEGRVDAPIKGLGRSAISKQQELVNQEILGKEALLRDPSSAENEDSTLVEKNLAALKNKQKELNNLTADPESPFKAPTKVNEPKLEIKNPPQETEQKGYSKDPYVENYLSFSTDIYEILPVKFFENIDGFKPNDITSLVTKNQINEFIRKGGVFNRYYNNDITPTEKKAGFSVDLQNEFVKNAILEKRIGAAKYLKKSADVLDTTELGYNKDKIIEGIKAAQYKGGFRKQIKALQAAKRRSDEKLAKEYRGDPLIVENKRKVFGKRVAAIKELADVYGAIIAQDNSGDKNAPHYRGGFSRKQVRIPINNSMFQNLIRESEVLGYGESDYRKSDTRTKAKTEAKTDDATKNPEVIKEAEAVAETKVETKVETDEGAFSSDAEFKRKNGPFTPGENKIAEDTANETKNIDETIKNRKGTNTGNVERQTEGFIDQRSSWEQLKQNFSFKNIAALASEQRIKLFKIYTLRMLNDTNDMLGANKMVQFLENLKVVEASVAFRNSVINEAAKIGDFIQKFRKGKYKGRDGNDWLNDTAYIMNSSTIRGIDVSNPKELEELPSDDPLRKGWESLPPQAKQVYTKLKNFYQEQTDAYVEDLVEKIQRNTPDDKTLRVSKIAEILLDFGSAEQIKKDRYETVLDENNKIVKQKINYVQEYINVFKKELQAYKDSQTFNEDTLTIKDALDTIGKPDENIIYLEKKIRKLETKKPRRIRPYFPLRRYGQYWFQVNKENQRDAEEFYMFETLADRDYWLEQRKIELAADKEQNKNLDLSIGGQGDRLLDAVDSFNVTQKLSQKMTDLVDSVVKNTPSDKADSPALRATKRTQLEEDLKNGIAQLTFMSLPEGNIRKAFISRKGIKGASTDLAKTFSSQTISFAYQRARLKYTDQYYQTLIGARQNANAEEDVKRKALKIDLVREMESRAGHVLGIEPTSDFEKISNKITQTTFLWLLTAPMSGLINILGMAAIGMPFLGARFGFAQTNKLMAAYTFKYASTAPKIFNKQKLDDQGKPVVDEFGQPVFSDFTTKYPTLEKRLDELSSDPEKQKILKKAYERFVHDNDVNASLTHDFIGELEKKQLVKSGYDSVVGNISALFHNSERFQREIMLMTGFELAYDANTSKFDSKTGKGGLDSSKAFEAAVQESKNLTAMSLGDFTRAGKPPLISGPVGRIFFQFKQYSLIQTYNLLRNGFIALKPNPNDDKELARSKKEAAKRMAGMLAMTGLFAGLTGMPIYTFTTIAIESLSAIFLDEEDEIEDGEAFLHNLLIQVVGNRGAAMAMRGPLGDLTNIGIADRVSLDLKTLWMRDSGYQEDSESAFVETLFGMAGPSVSLVRNAFRANDLLNDYNPQAAVETISPIIVKSMLKAKRYYDADYTATSVTKGNVIQEDLDVVDLLYQAMGASPENVLRKQKVAIAKKGRELKIQRRRQHILGGIFLGLQGDDEDTYNQAMDAVFKFNKKYPEYPITGDTIQRSVLRRFKGLSEREANNGVVLNRTLLPRIQDEFSDYSDTGIL